MGFVWAVVQPVVAAVLFALFLGRYANVPSEGAPYLLFVLAGCSALLSSLAILPLRSVR